MTKSYIREIERIVIEPFEVFLRSFFVQRYISDLKRVARVSPKCRNMFRHLDLYADHLKTDIHYIYTSRPVAP